MRNGLLLIVFALGGISVAAQAPGSPATLPADVMLTTLDSTELRSAAAWGKKRRPTVLAFWLTTCPPCQRELATYTQKYPEWKKKADFQLYAISIDHPPRFRKVVQTARERAFPFPVYWDRIQAFKAYMPGGLNGLPQVFLFDKNNKLVWQHKGYRPGDEEVLFAKIMELQ
jgi:cytochrome c biogenesis protein CcmG/thiol:disulfide interchange protein DsbE